MNSFSQHEEKERHANETVCKLTKIVPFFANKTRCEIECTRCVTSIIGDKMKCHICIELFVDLSINNKSINIQ